METAFTIESYLISLPEDRKSAIEKLFYTIEKNIPQGFEAAMSYKLPGFVVPHTLFPAGYHCNPKEPLPFISLASQKNYISLYHMGFYVDGLEEWFRNEYSKISLKKLDLGKCCIRFKKVQDIPFELIGTLASKITVNEWIAFYEKNLKK